MSRELLILRHGQAGQAARDFDRRLTERGIEDIARLRAWITSEGCAPSLTVSSPAMRARMTAESAGDDPVFDERIYDASAMTLLAVLAGQPASSARVMLVGHNPGLSHLASYLSGRGVRLSPGSLVRLAMPATWDQLESGCAELIHSVDAVDLAP